MKKRKPGYPAGWFDRPAPAPEVLVRRVGYDRRKPSYAAERAELWRQGKRHCHYCSLKLTLARDLPHSMTLDHFIPLSRRGRNTPSNYRAACIPCNGAKGELLPHEFDEAILNGTVIWPGSGQKRKQEKFMAQVEAARAKRKP